MFQLSESQNTKNRKNKDVICCGFSIFFKWLQAAKFFH